MCECKNVNFIATMSTFRMGGGWGGTFNKLLCFKGAFCDSQISDIHFLWWYYFTRYACTYKVFFRLFIPLWVYICEFTFCYKMSNMQLLHWPTVTTVTLTYCYHWPTVTTVTLTYCYTDLLFCISFTIWPKIHCYTWHDQTDQSGRWEYRF